MASIGLERVLLCRNCAIPSRWTNIPTRSFTNSSARPSQVRRDVLPNFEPFSSEELNNIVFTLREKVFVPAHMTQSQQRLIRSQKNRASLLRDYMYAEFGEEKVRLTPVNVLTDLPSTTKSLRRIVDLMEPDDWANLPLLLQELKLARRKLKLPVAAKMARKAANAGRQAVIIECAKQVDRTNFQLKEPELVWEVMYGAHLIAVQGEWDEASTRKAFNQALLVVELLEDERHSGLPEVQTSDARVQPQIIGILLELTAARATKHLGGKDEDGRVQLYTERLMTNWHIAKIPTSEQLGNESKSALASTLLMWSPVLNGLKMAKEVLKPGSNVAQWAEKTSADLQNILTQTKDAFESKADESDRKQRRGWLAYKELIA